MPIEYSKTPMPQGRKGKTMRITMLSDKRTAVDGINQFDYKAGETYDIPEGKALRWIENGRAVLYSREVKMVAQAPENKMEPAPSQNKAKPKRNAK